MSLPCEGQQVHQFIAHPNNIHPLPTRSNSSAFGNGHAIQTAIKAIAADGWTVVKPPAKSKNSRSEEKEISVSGEASMRWLRACTNMRHPVQRYDGIVVFATAPVMPGYEFRFWEHGNQTRSRCVVKSLNETIGYYLSGIPCSIPPSIPRQMYAPSHHNSC